MHGRHTELGATDRWAGDWRRAYDYGDPEGEALAVQTTAGLIDVSTLGKLIVRGPDAGELLDRLYPNRMSTLKPGRIRYGVLTSDAGRITDDGTVGRIDDETFYVTTTSSGAAAVEAWFTWWLADWGLDCRLTDVTQGVAAMNLAGPQAREIVREACPADLRGYVVDDVAVLRPEAAGRERANERHEIPRVAPSLCRNKRGGRRCKRTSFVRCWPARARPHGSDQRSPYRAAARGRLRITCGCGHSRSSLAICDAPGATLIQRKSVCEAVCHNRR